MKILVDENVPYAAEALGAFGDVVSANGRAITCNALEDVDALIVRSITQVDAALLDGSRVRFVGTATVGTDHLDLDWLRSREIVVADAAGCSTDSVAEYVLAALVALEARGVIRQEGAALGLIGVGRIGSRVATLAGALGLHVVEHDPPRELLDPAFRSAALADVLACDIVSLHVPLTTSGPDATWHLANDALLSRMRAGAVLINTSRGSVVDSSALVRVAPRLGAIVLDVWEGEPNVPPEVITATAIATPHVAGYSYNGRMRGTWMMAEALAHFAGMPNAWVWPPPVHAPTIRVRTGEGAIAKVLRAIGSVYDIVRDDTMFRATLTLDEAERRTAFDALRRHYPVRFELGDALISGLSDAEEATLRGLGVHAVTRDG